MIKTPRKIRAAQPPSLADYKLKIGDKTMRIKTANVSLRERYERGEITLKEVAREFCRLGWTNYTDENTALRYMYGI